MELQPVNFRAGSHYVELLLMAFAFFAVGRQRQVDIFKLLLLCISGVMAFHSMRDGWFICITAGACIADGLADAVQSEPGGTWLESVAVWALVAVLWAVLAPRFDFSTAGLERAMSEYLPVNAVNYLRKHPAPGPLYNAINWGGFLIWQLPDRPVAIDDRTDLYGDKLEELSFRTAVGAPSWLNDPYLNEAGVVIVEQRSRLKALLETDPRFQLAYQDRLAALFFRR